MNTCRFELKIKGTDMFQCAAKYGFSGWAYLWTHKERWSDPCVDCPIQINGKSLLIDRELKPEEFGEIAGKRIRNKDWAEIEKRGYEINSRGIERMTNK